MANTIKLHLLDNKQVKAEMQGLPLSTDNAYRIIAGEEESTIFTIQSKPTQYSAFDYYVVLINSQGYKVPLDESEGTVVEGEDGQRLIGSSFTLPVGMATAGYGYIGIYAKGTNSLLEEEKVTFQPVKIKVWNFIPTWKDNVSGDIIVEGGNITVSGTVYSTAGVGEIGFTTNGANFTSNSGDFKSQYGAGEFHNLRIKKRYSGDTGGNAEIDGNLTVQNRNILNEIDGKQDEIDNNHKLPADLVDDTNSMHKFVTEAEKSQIATNASDISDLTSGLANKVDKNAIKQTTGNSTTDIMSQKAVTDALLLKLPTSTKYGASVSLTINSSTYVITAQLKDQDGNNLGAAQTIDLPLESVVVSGSYSDTTESIILTLQNGNTVNIPVGDLVSGLQSEITAQNPLNADLVDDTNSAHKFVTAAEKTAIANAVPDTRTVNGHALSSDVTVTKADVGLGNVDNTSDLDKPISTATQTALDGKQDKIDSTHKLSADLIEDGTTNKVFTATEQSKLSGIESGAQANTVDSVNGQTGTVVLDCVPTSRTIAGNALTGDISAQTLTDSLVYMNATTDLDDIFAD